MWVLKSWAHTPGDLLRIWTADNGFYRPVVALSFAANAWLFGAAPLGYGLTNVLLALACGAAVMFLARSFGLSRGAAWMAGLLWLMNFYFGKTAVLWISGRTSLLATLGSVLAAALLVRGRIVASLLCLAVALFSKEDALLVPVILTAWLFIPQSRYPRSPLVDVPRRIWWVVGAALLVGAYLAARSVTGAMTPGTAPTYYQFVLTPSIVARNVVEYADRTSSLPIAATIGAGVLLGFGTTARRDLTWRVAVCGALWLGIGLGFAYVLPIRSDLYAALPAVGASLAGAAVAAELWLASRDAARERALVASMALWLLLVPVYWLRSERMVHVAEFSSARLEELTSILSDAPDSAVVRVDDVESNDPRSPNLAAAFGAGIEEAYTVRTGRRLSITLVEPNVPEDDKAPSPTRRLVLDNGHLWPPR